MQLYYREFLATRERSEGGLEIKEIEAHAWNPDAVVNQSKIWSIFNRFSYDLYEKKAYFLFYEESMKTFVAAKAESGEEIDNRINMKIFLRIPERIVQDGFEECLCFLKEWGEEQGETVEIFHTVKEICKKYEVTEQWLIGFMAAWHQKMFAFETEPIFFSEKNICSSNTMEFVCAIAKLCYEILPSKAITRYSLVWNAPKNSKSFRIMIGETRKNGDIWNVMQEKQVPLAVAETFMYTMIADKFLENQEKGKHFLDSFYAYHIQTNRYQYMLWNFYYYLLDQEQKLPVSAESFCEMEAEIRQQKEQGIEKAGELYETLLFSVIQTEISVMQAQEILNRFLSVLLQEKKYHKNQIENFWDLLEKCADDQEIKEKQKNILVYFKEIKKYSESLYYELINEGLSRKETYLLDLLEIEKLKRREDVEKWWKNPLHKYLEEQIDVKSLLMNQLKEFLKQSEDPGEEYEIIKTGIRIDKNMSLKIGEEYLKERTKPFLTRKDIVGWSGYLLQRKKIWKSSRPYLIFITEQYLELTEYLEMPFNKQTIESVIEIGTVLFQSGNEKKTQALGEGQEPYISKADVVQRKLLDRMCDFFEQENHYEITNDWSILDMLIEWQAGNKKTTPELVRAEKILENIRYREEQYKIENANIKQLLSMKLQDCSEKKETLYSMWIEKLTDQINDLEWAEEILVEIPKRADDLKQFSLCFEMTELFKKLLKRAGEKNNVFFMEYILQTAESFPEQVELLQLKNLFWSNCVLDDFPLVLEYEEKLWGHKRIFQSGQTGNENEKLYCIYRSFYRMEHLEKTEREIHALKSIVQKETMEQFFELLIGVWFDSLKNKTEFETLLDLLMAYWEDEKTLIQELQQMSFDKERKRKILSYIKEYSEDREWECKSCSLPEIVFVGFLLSGFLGGIGAVLKVSQYSYGVLFYAGVLLCSLAGVAMIGVGYNWFIQRKVRFPLEAILIGMAGWLILSFAMLFLSGKEGIIAVISYILILLSGISLVLLKRKEKGKR